MWDCNDVVKIQYRQDYVCKVVFDNGIEGEADFTEYLNAGPVFEPLKNLAFFRQARIEAGTISWPNSADIAPVTLYEKIESI